MDFTPNIPMILVVMLSLDWPCIIADDNRLLSLASPDDYLNICMDGISHKQKPGPESQLFDKVTFLYCITLNRVLHAGLLG